MPFKKVGPDDYVSPSGRHWTSAQVRLYHATSGFTKKPKRKREVAYAARTADDLLAEARQQVVQEFWSDVARAAAVAARRQRAGATAYAADLNRITAKRRADEQGRAQRLAAYAKRDAPKKASGGRAKAPVKPRPTRVRMAAASYRKGNAWGSGRMRTG